MNIGVFGLWHLGTVIAASLAAAGHSVVGLEEDSIRLDTLKQGWAPLFEPGLDLLIRQGLESGSLRFTSEKRALSHLPLVWIAFDTPVDSDDRADVSFVLNQARALFPLLQDETIVVISSQLPVGSTRQLMQEFQATYPNRRLHFAYSPENLRLGKAIDAFHNQERIVIGTDPGFPRESLTSLLQPFARELLWMGIESAEMSKHALNSFLALSVTFANELATLSERVGADAREVESALRSEPRVGSKAFIRPGFAFGGGTLARDVLFLTEKASQQGLKTPLLSSIIPSNNQHRNWSVNRLREHLGSLRGLRVGVLGLAYKPQTSSTRSSLALVICRSLLQEGASVTAFDPQVKSLPESSVTLSDTIDSLLSSVDAVIVATEWPEFLQFSKEQLDTLSRKPLIDQSGFLKSLMKSLRPRHYLTLGATP